MKTLVISNKYISTGLLVFLLCGCSDNGLNLAGKWQTNWGYIVMVQKGNKVMGTYTHDNGKIEGIVSGNKFVGRWSEEPSYAPPKDAGEFDFTVADNGNSFAGRWRYGYGGEGTSEYFYDWYGTRAN